MKLVGWPQYYWPSTAATGVMAEANSVAHKLADTAINALRASAYTTGGENVYRFKCAGSSKWAWMKSNDAWVDSSASWGLLIGGSKKNAMTTVNTFSSVGSYSTFTQTWIDYYHGGTGGSNDRYFMGHGQFDCYNDSPTGQRCFKGGQHGYGQAWTDCEVYLLVATA